MVEMVRGGGRWVRAARARVVVTASKSRRGEADRIALLVPEGTLSPEVV